MVLMEESYMPISWDPQSVQIQGAHINQVHFIMRRLKGGNVDLPYLLQIQRLLQSRQADL